MRYFYLLILIFLAFGCGTFAGHHDNIAGDFFRDVGVDTIPIIGSNDTFITISDDAVTTGIYIYEFNNEYYRDTIRPVKSYISSPHMADSLILRNERH